MTVCCYVNTMMMNELCPLLLISIREVLGPLLFISPVCVVCTSLACLLLKSLAAYLVDITVILTHNERTMAYAKQSSL